MKRKAKKDPHRKTKEQGHFRSSLWSTVRKHFLAEWEPKCAVCGGTKKLEVHHILPFHVDKQKELNPHNLITLCEAKRFNCHLFVGHLGDYRGWNPNAARDAKIISKLIKSNQSRIKKHQNKTPQLKPKPKPKPKKK